MKLFFEAVEKIESEEREQEFVKKEVKSRGEAENLAKNYSRAKYNLRLHYCYHDEEVSKPCTAEEL